MERNSRLKTFLIILFFLSLVIVGTDISTQRLALITKEDITMPFFMEGNNQELNLYLLGNQYNYSLIPIANKYTYTKAAIQNSWGTVKCSLAPRVEYLDKLWLKGIGQLDNDLKKMSQTFLKVEKGE